jgi:hypothetical protein
MCAQLFALVAARRHLGSAYDMFTTLPVRRNGVEQCAISHNRAHDRFRGVSLRQNSKPRYNSLYKNSFGKRDLGRATDGFSYQSIHGPFQ